MLATTCYSRDELQRYLHGTAGDELSGAIESHLDSCSRCEDTLAELDHTDDTLVRTLKVKGGDNGADVPAWIEQVASAPYQAETATKEPVAQPRGQLGDYVLEKVLGRGGMSVVFAARHQHLGRQVALKVLLPTTQQHAVSRERFSREMRAVGVLDHPAIVRATDAGQCDETLYLVMEQIDGVDLNRVSKSAGPLRVADACAIVMEAARGLAHAHARGVVHRDVKPSNLMLDQQGNVKILDFGLARMQSAACDVSLQTTMGQLLGTLDYMAPEQASGSDVDARADVYALGATLFKLLAGVPPHGRSSDFPIIEFLNRLATTDAKSLDELRDSLPADLAETVAAMLQRNPEDRIATAQEVADRLEPFAAGADLDGLSRRTLEKVADVGDDSFASVKATLSDLFAGPPKSDDSSSSSQQKPDRSADGLAPSFDRPDSIGVIGWTGFIAGVISFIGLAWLGIIVTLKSQQGEIRIESEIEDLQVEIVDEKDRADVISVQQGQAITTVRAGRYRIRLASPSDGIEITPNDIQVTRGDVIVAKIKQRGTANQPVDREPLVAMEAQLMLVEAEAELAEAKQQQDADRIEALEERLTQLRALSRPIPTEPVYQGRTLADWVAQMRYEQEKKAREIAATNVLMLAKTRPDAEQADLALESGYRSFQWSGQSVAGGLLTEIRSDASDTRLTKIGKIISDIDRQIAASLLKASLAGDNVPLRDYALVLCADLRQQIRGGGWPAIVPALEELCKDTSGENAAARQIVLALCVPDDARAVALLREIDWIRASEDSLLAMIYAADHRKLEIPREQQIAWLGNYFDRLPYDNSPAVPYRPMYKLWNRPSVGPFRNLDREEIDSATQDEFNAVIAPVLDSLAHHLDEVDANRRDMQRQLAAATKSYFLIVFLRDADLTGPTRDRAVKLLGRRLDQLIRFRSEHDQQPPPEMDLPGDVAVAILLLTGEVPASIRKQSSSEETGYMARQLAAAGKTLTEHDGVIMFRGSSNVGSISRSGGSISLGGMVTKPRIAGWYPYEMMAILDESLTIMRAANQQRRSSRQRPPSDRSLMSGIVDRNHNWKPDSRLMLEYAAESEAAARFVTSVLDGDYFKISMRLHPELDEAVKRFTIEADDPPAVALGLGIWKDNKSEQQFLAEMFRWMETGDALHVHWAIGELGGIDSRADSQRFLGQWSKRIAAAIDRIASIDALSDIDMHYLEELGDKAPNAAAHALTYLQSWLERPQRRSGADISPSCVNILARDPGRLEPFRARIEQELGQPSDEDRTSLQRLWNLLPDVAPEKNSR